METFVNQDMEFIFTLVSSDRLSLKVLEKGEFPRKYRIEIGGENCHED